MDFYDTLPTVLAVITKARSRPPVGFLGESSGPRYCSAQGIVNFDLVIVRWLYLKTVLHKQHRFLGNI
jgi:hypothetical protein